VGCGTLFRLNPGTGAKTILHSFSSVTDGSGPNGGLIADAAGTIYGTTTSGGAHSGGTIFRFDPVTRTLTTLHAFTGGAGGAVPNPLAFDGGGALYGTAAGGGANSSGTIFKYDPAARSFTTLYSFAPARGDGTNPNGSLAFDGKSAFYGTAQAGGAHSAGTLFKIDPAAKTLTTLYAFTGGSDGALPDGGMRFGIFGLLFGVTREGGDHVGTIFLFNPYSGQLQTLYTFPLGLNPSGPTGGIVIGPTGVLLGEIGGQGGKIFTLDSQRQLTWLHAFTTADGSYPAGGLTLDKAGALYGATATGGIKSNDCALRPILGPFGCGTVFKLTP